MAREILFKAKRECNGEWVQETNECEELLINLCTERWTFYRGEYKRAEVIGNIFDNPELLGVESDDSSR